MQSPLLKVRAELLKNSSALGYLPVTAVGCSLLILAVAICLGQQRLRSQLRSQLADREGQTLFALWSGHLAGRGSDLLKCFSAPCWE